MARDIIINKLKPYSGLESKEVFVLGIQKELFLFAERYSIPHYSASMILYNSLCGEIWSIGDCQYWLNRVVQKSESSVFRGSGYSTLFIFGGGIFRNRYA